MQSLMQFLERSCCRISAVVFLSTVEFPLLKCLFYSHSFCFDVREIEGLLYFAVLSDF